MAGLLQHFRSQIGHWATEWLRCLVVQNTFFRETEVSQQDMALLIQNYVVWFQISEDDVSIVEIFQSKENLSQINASSIFAQSFFSQQHFPKVSAWTIIKDQEQFSPGLKGKIETDNEWVTSIWKNIPFSNRILH